MTNPTNTRVKFISLANEIRQLQKLPELRMPDEPEEIRREHLVVDEIGFEAIHFPTPGIDFVLHCSFGKIVPAKRDEVMKRAMFANGVLANTFTSMFALKKDTSELIYSAPDAVEKADAASMLQSMHQIADVAKSWRNAGLLCSSGGADE